jgi:hypothetical protein
LIPGFDHDAPPTTIATWPSRTARAAGNSTFAGGLLIARISVSYVSSGLLSARVGATSPYRGQFGHTVKVGVEQIGVDIAAIELHRNAVDVNGHVAGAPLPECAHSS